MDFHHPASPAEAVHPDTLGTRFGTSVTALLCQIARWAALCADYCHAATIYEQLSALSDADLRRRGLSRELWPTMCAARSSAVLKDERGLQRPSAMPALAQSATGNRTMRLEEIKLACSSAKVGALLLVLALLADGVAPPARAQGAEPSAAELMDALMWGHHPVDTSFSLTDHQGKLRTHEDFRGKLLIVYFGYMFCPDICPTDLQVIAQAVDQLGPAGDAVQPLFITIDPERDTPDKLSGYVPLFHARLIGLTGSRADIRRVAHGYKAYFAKASQASMSDYMLDHSAFIYLVDAEGRYAGFLPPGTTVDRLVEAIRSHLTNVSR